VLPVQQEIQQQQQIHLFHRLLIVNRNVFEKKNESKYFLFYLAPTIYDCDFECNCTCNWKHDDTATYQWIVVRGSTLTVGTGPDGDHTTGSRFGFFMHIETSSPAKLNDTSRLISPDLTVTDKEQCFRFYYHMYGSDVYRLNIYARISKSKRFVEMNFSIRLFRWQSWQSFMAKRRQSSN
jgi:hypothetical protein